MKEDEFFTVEVRGNNSLHLLVNVLSLRGILLLPIRLSAVSSSTCTTDVSSSSYALIRPSFDPFLFEPSVKTVDEDKAKNGESSGWDRREEGVRRGRRNERR